MSKPKNMTPEQDEAWRDKENARHKAYNQSPERKATQKAYGQSPEGKASHKAYRESPEGKATRKAYKQSVLSQAAADQFFIMAGAAESLTNLITKK